MSVTTTQYIRKPLFVDAVRVTASKIDEIADWCQGEVLWEESPGNKGTGKKYIRVRVHQPKNIRQTKAFVGDWILYTERGYKIYTNKAFQLAFDEVGTQAEEEPIIYPFSEGDTLVLGPETFVAQDGSVLNWKGTNYVRQTEVDEEEQEAAEDAVELEEARTEGLVAAEEAA